MYVYFPSCNFTRMFPALSVQVKEFLRARGVEIAGCCRLGYDKLPEGAQPLTICQTCSIIVGENNPTQPPISVFEYLDGLDDVTWPDHTGETITLQDCFRAQGHDSEKRAIRSLLHKMGYTVIEAPDQETFDGRFLFAPMRPGNLKLAPKTFSEFEKAVVPCSAEEGLARLQAYCAQFTTDTVVCYCNSCCSGLQEGLPAGKKAVHLAALLMDFDEKNA